MAHQLPAARGAGAGANALRAWHAGSGRADHAGRDYRQRVRAGVATLCPGLPPPAFTRRRRRRLQVLVLPPYQGAGIGKEMLRAAYALARERGAADLTVRAPLRPFAPLCVRARVCVRCFWWARRKKGVVYAGPWLRLALKPPLSSPPLSSPRLPV